MDQKDRNVLRKRDFGKKICKQADLENISLEENYERVYSLNQMHWSQKIVGNATKIIVGTLTPPDGMANGYYYSSSPNKVFGIIDKCYKDNGTFVGLKKQLLANRKNKEIIKQIEEKLLEHNIAFIDVVDQAIRVKGSYLDEDIVLYSLDFKAFRNCNEHQTFICTSQNARKGLEEIINQDPSIKINRDNIVVCYQDRFHYKEEDWKNGLRR